MNNYLNFAVVQEGYCVFGAGSTESAAYEDAALSLETRQSDDEPYTAKMVKDQCEEFQFVGDLRLICRADDEEEFDSYMKEQGYKFDGTGWL